MSSVKIMWKSLLDFYRFKGVFHMLFSSKVTIFLMSSRLRCKLAVNENQLSLNSLAKWSNRFSQVQNAVMWEIWIKMTLSKISDVHNCLWLYVICIEIGLSRMIYHFLRHDNSLVTIPFQTWAHLLVILTAWNFWAHAIWRRYQGSLNIQNHRTFS